MQLVACSLQLAAPSVSVTGALGADTLWYGVASATEVSTAYATQLGQHGLLSNALGGLAFAGWALILGFVAYRALRQRRAGSEWGEACCAVDQGGCAAAIAAKEPEGVEPASCKLQVASCKL